MNYPIIKISKYNAHINKEGKPSPGGRPYDTDFYTEMNNIASGAYKQIVDNCRKLTDKKERDYYKITKLPSLTISSVVAKWRKIDNVVNHTGLLNIDIDATGNPQVEDWAGLRDQIFQLKSVVAAFLSVSGNGVTFVVKVEPSEHKDVFFSIADDMKKYLNITCDTGVHDVVRLRFVSDDPECKIRYNFDEIPICHPTAEYLASQKEYGYSGSVLEPIGDADSEHNYNEAVKKASAKTTFSDGSKHFFMVSVAGACNVMGMSEDFCKQMTIARYGEKSRISARELVKPIEFVYKTYRSQHATYDIEAKSEWLNRQIKNKLVYEWLHEGLRPSPDQISEIAQELSANIERVQAMVERVYGEFAQEFGYNDFPAIEKVEIWLNKRWSFKYNVVTQQPELTPVGTDIVEPVNTDEIYRQLQRNRFAYGLNNVKSLIKSEFSRRYDPISDYFHSLTYDSSRDYIDELANHITITDQDFWRSQFKKCLVRSIVCGLGKKENRLVMVLYGKKQESGKSTFIRYLSPWSDSQYFTESPIIGGNTKDTEIRFTENFIYNMEELAGLNRADVNKLKSDISKAVIKERRAYASHETSAPRRCNFWASTNQKEFLHDDENTRWLIFEVIKIDWGYTKTIPIDKVWAQAWHLYQNGFDYQLTVEDRQRREAVNDNYRYRRPEEELLLLHFQPSDKIRGKFFSSTQIANYLNSLSSSLHVNPNNIGKTMTALFNLESQIAKIDGRSIRGYYLNQIALDVDRELPDGGKQDGFTPISDENPF